MLDTCFRHAKVADGSGNPAFLADVGVRDGRIVGVGDLSGMHARHNVNCAGAVLAPGFIDLHTHTDFSLPSYPGAEAMTRQGVTTHLAGNCGFSPFPVRAETLPLLRSYAEFIGAGLSYDWEDADGYAGMLESLPLGCNIALQVGHGTLRIAVMGFDDRPPTQAETERMADLAARAFEQGVFGLSSGLIYAPGSFAATDELVAMACAAAGHGAFYSTHIRGEGATLVDAVCEALEIGRRSGAPVQISHHKASGRQNWGQVRETLGLIDRARAKGQDVLADQYPYTAGSTTLAAILPRWVLEGGVERMLERLADPETRARIKDLLLPPEGARQAEAREFDPEAIMISSVPDGPNKVHEGSMLAEIARDRGEHPLDTALHLLREERGGVQMIIFSMSEEDVRTVMRHRAVTVASDGWTLSPSSGGKPHPRSYGTFARVLGTYVREEHVLPLEEAVRKMTSLPAGRLRLGDRGTVRPGGIADLVVFDPSTVSSPATFKDPHRFCEGVLHVMIGGQFVVEMGEDTGARPGRVLRKTKSTRR